MLTVSRYLRLVTALLVSVCILSTGFVTLADDDLPFTHGSATPVAPAAVEVLHGTALWQSANPFPNTMVREEVVVAYSASGYVGIASIPLRVRVDELPPPPVEEPVEEETPYEVTEPVRRSLITLSDEDRHLLEGVVMGESGWEPFDGIHAVAQAFYNAMVRSGTTVSETIVAYGWYAPWSNPNDSVRRAVSMVFDEGIMLFDDEPTMMWFYAPALVHSWWHETMRFVVEIGGHRFFAMWD